jgi:hypothetical protein
MTERPILFQGAMVRALLAGTKTQTRRVAKGVVARHSRTGEALANLDSAGPRVTFPYGQPGDRLWVRETWYCDDFRVQRGPYLKPDDMDMEAARADGTMVYRASSGDRPYEAEQPLWRPAIHMPRWASRITLEVTGVRVERLQDISIEDAKAEGAWPDVSVVDDCAKYFGTDVLAANPYRAFQMLWERINGVDAWAVNPWVWVVEFKRVQP